jgi:hypothetical protein
MNDIDTSNYKTIQVGNLSYVMDEALAFQVLHAMKDEFGWAGTVFCEDDVRTTIADRREADDKEPYTEDKMDEAVATIMNSHAWTKFMEEWMCQEGFEVLNNAVFDEIEWLEEKALKEQEA